MLALTLKRIPGRAINRYAFRKITAKYRVGRKLNGEYKVFLHNHSMDFKKRLIGDLEKIGLELDKIQGKWYN